MKKNRNHIGRAVSLVGMAVFTLGMIGARTFAQDVKITGEPCPLTLFSQEAVEEGAGETGKTVGNEAENQAVNQAENQAENQTADETVKTQKTVLASMLDLLGVADEMYVAVEVEGEYGFVPVREIEEKLPTVDLSTLPAADGWENLTVGSSGEMVRVVQETLIELGYLNGTADGAFGRMSAEAVKAFQTAAGLESTVEMDLFSYFLLCEEAGGEKMAVEAVYPPVYTVEEKFAAIYEDMEDASVLEAWLDPEYKFSYDVFEGIGEITCGRQIAAYEDAARPIDRIAMDVEEIVYIARNEEDKVEAVPSLKLTCQGAYRPYAQEVKVRCANRVESLPVLEKRGQLEGTDVCETAIFPLTEEASNLLEEIRSGENGEIRIVGSSHVYDMQMN